jgi:hypothetical protein
MSEMSHANFGRKTLSEQVADSLEDLIRRGVWSGLAPSSRDIASRKNVSLPTAQEALAHLVLRKVLRERGPKRRLEIVPTVGSAVAGDPCPASVLVVSTEPLCSLDATTMLAVRQLESTLHLLGHRFHLLDLGHLSGDALRKAGYAAVVDFQATHCLMVSANPVLYSGLARHAVAIAALHGKLNAKRLQRLAMPFHARLDFALQHLAALGHHEVLLVRRCDGELPDLGDEPSAKCGGRAGVTLRLQTYHALSDFPQAMQNGLRRGATVVLFVNLEDAVHGLIYCKNNQILVPGQLSLVNLAGELDTSKDSPTLAGVALGLEARAASVLHWVHPESPTALVSFNLKEGESLGPIPQVAVKVA